MSKNNGGMESVIGTGTGTLNAATDYVLSLVVTSTTIAATINGVTVNITDSAINTGTKFGLQFITHNPALGTGPHFKTLSVTA